VLALCMLSCRPQTSGVLMLAAAVALTGAVTILLTLLFLGLLDGNPLVRTVEILRAGVTRVFENAVEMQIAEGLPLQYSKLDIKNISALLGNIFPALFLVCSALLAYAMWRMMLRISVEWHILPRVPLRLAVLTVSPYAAAVFTLSFLASLLANASKLTLFGVLCENISLLLEPALALVGFSSLSPRRATSCLSHALGIGLLILLCYDLGSGLILASFLGAFHILWSRFAPRDKGGK
jgi:hypothetical protein